MRKFASSVDGYFRGLFGSRDIEPGSCVELAGDCSLPDLSERISLTGYRHDDESGSGEAKEEVRADEFQILSSEEASMFVVVSLSSRRLVVSMDDTQPMSTFWNDASMKFVVADCCHNAQILSRSGR